MTVVAHPEPALGHALADQGFVKLGRNGESAALEWAKRRGARSGRTAWQFVTELAGRAGRAL